MTQDEIIEMAEQSNLLGVIDSFHYDTKNWVEEAMAFAKLVAAKERADCIYTASIAFLGSEKKLADRVLNALLERGKA